MRFLLVSFAAAVLFSTFVATTRAQSLDDNEHYSAFKSAPAQRLSEVEQASDSEYAVACQLRTEESRRWLV